MYPSLFWIIFYRVMYIRIGVRGSNRGIVNWTRMTRFQDRDKANVCTFVSELINSQPLSALTRLHLKIENTLSALMRLNLKIAKKSGCLHLNVWTKKVYHFIRIRKARHFNFSEQQATVKLHSNLTKSIQSSTQRI